MRLHVLGSSSSGNCYLLENGTECLILEAGVRPQDALKAIDFRFSMIIGCLVSHEHGDHAKYARDYTKAAIDVYASKGTLSELGTTGYRYRELSSGQLSHIGLFKILPFAVMHDCAEPLGFLIKHPDMGTLLFATDTYYIPNTFRGLNHIMIECNYSHEILAENVESGLVDRSVMSRVSSSHMELDTCKSFLRANDINNVNNIILLHLSSQNGNKNAFKCEIEKLTGKQVSVAEKSLSIDLSVNDF